MATHLIFDLTCGTRDKHVTYARKHVRPDVEHLLDGSGLRPMETPMTARSTFTKGYVAALTDPHHDGWWIVTDTWVDPDHPAGESHLRQGKLTIRRIQRRGHLWGPGEPEL